jgi:hypothetical protein
VLVMEVAQVGAEFKFGLQIGVVKLGGQVRVAKLVYFSWDVQLECSTRCVQGGCCGFLVSIFRWSKTPHHFKVNPLMENPHRVTSVVLHCRTHVPCVVGVGGPGSSLCGFGACTYLYVRELYGFVPMLIVQS